MKKSMLLLLSLVPFLVGCAVNILIVNPVIGMTCFFLLPWLTTVFWLYLGTQYARRWKPISAVLLAHAVGICSLVVYIWQFVFETDATRNSMLALYSQMYTFSTPSHLFYGIANLVERDPHNAGIASSVALQVIALAYMIVVFCIGMYWEKKKKA